MSIWNKFLGVKADQANEAVTRFAASRDPDGIGEAALQVLVTQLRGAQEVLGRRLAAVGEAKAVVEQDKVNVRKLMGAAEVLATGGNEAKATLTLDKVDEANTRLEADKRHLEGAQKSADLAKSAVDDLESRLRTGRQAIETRKRDMSDARIEREQAKDREALATRDAGLAHSADDFDAVLKAMDAETGKLRVETETAKRMAGALASVGGGIENDPEVAAAMAQAEGKAAPRQSVAERLAATRAKLGEAA